MRRPPPTPARTTAAALVLAAMALAQGDLPGDLRARLPALLPSRVQAASLLSWDRLPEIVRIEQRIWQVGTQDPRWFQAYLSGAASGRPLEYDARLGVSAEEFNKWQAFRTIYRLQTVGTARFTVTRSGNKLIFGGSQGAEALQGLSIDLNTGEARAPGGFTGKPRALHVSAERNRYGVGEAWGWAWTIQGHDPASKSAMLAYLGVVELSNKDVLISFKRNLQFNGVAQPSVDLNLRYTR